MVGIQYLDTDRNFLPFEHRLEPGRYKLERSFIQNHCFAIRLLVDEDRPATKYVPALRRLPLKGSATNPRNVISESGCHSISPVLFDASTFLGSDSRDVEKLKINFSRTLEANRDWLSTHYHSGAKSLVKVPSYPKYSVGAPIGEYDVVSMFEYCDAIHCYWGVTDDGEVASLVAVFGLVIEPVYETLEIDWDISMLGQPLSHPTLKKMGLNIVLDQPDRPQVRFSGQLPYVGGIRKFKLEDTSGIVFEPDLRMHRDSIQLPVKQYLRTGKKRLGDYQSLKIRMEISTGHKFKF